MTRPYREMQAVAPSDPLELAIEALQTGDLSRAAGLAAERTRHAPADAAAWEVLSVACFRRGLLDPAIDAAGRAARLTPHQASRHANLGVILRAAGQVEAAERAYGAALLVDPAFASAHHNLGNLRLDQGRLHDAEASLREALRLQPGQAEAWRSLGMVLQRGGRLEEAVRANEAVLALDPDHALGLSEGGAYLMALGRHDEARARLERAVAVAPDLLGAHANLGVLHLHAGRPVASLKATLRALELDPSEQRAIGNLALALKDMALLSEAELLLRRALASRPDHAAGHSSLLVCLDCHPDRSPEAVSAEHRRWDEAHAKPPRPAAPGFGNDRNPERRLRVGFVSPDFREHPSRPFVEALLGGFDRERVALFCYAELARPDAASTRFQAIADGWRMTAGLPDTAVAQIIREDRIDVLVDLGGHGAASRLLVFAHRPAPIQIAYGLGHAGAAVGLSAIDVFLADETMVPEGDGALIAGAVLRLSRTPLAYAPPPGMPEPGPSPALGQGVVTFGYLGPAERINDKVAAAWAAILKRTRGSRLLLNGHLFGERACRTLLERRFAAHGVAPERLDLVDAGAPPRAWEAYARIDIALDPFPCNAAASAVEALWLGVPVVSLMNRRPVGRVGASLLAALDLSDWAAADVEAYVEKAVATAADPAALDDLRSGLRARFLASPLADAHGLGRELELALRGLWRRWVEQNPASGG